MSSNLRRIDKARFKKLTFPHLDFLYNVALKYTGSVYDAEDIVQESMYIAYRKFHQLRDDSKCRQWLFSILRTTFLREYRQLKRRPLLDDGTGYLKYLAGDSADSLATLLEKKFDREQIRELLLQLPEKYKSPLILYYMEEMTYQEISEYLEIPIGTVMSRLARAKQQLKKTLLKKAGKRVGRLNPLLFSIILQGAK